MNQTITMQTATIFKKPFEIPETKGQDANVYFAYQWLKFRVIITPVELEPGRLALTNRPLETLNFRLVINRSISTTIDANVEELESNPGKVEKLILQQIFSQKMARQILEGI